MRQGKGIHVYVPLADIPTENHTIHAVLAKAVLAKMSADTGRDFSADVDAYGGILFCWSTRASEAKRSYELLKPSRKSLPKPISPAGVRPCCPRGLARQSAVHARRNPPPSGMSYVRRSRSSRRTPSTLESWKNTSAAAGPFRGLPTSDATAFT